MGRCGGGGGFGCHHQEKPWFQQGTPEAIDLAEATLHAVAYDGRSDAAGYNDRSAGR